MFDRCSGVLVNDDAHGLRELPLIETVTLRFDISCGGDDWLRVCFHSRACIDGDNGCCRRLFAPLPHGAGQILDPLAPRAVALVPDQDAIPVAGMEIWMEVGGLRLVPVEGGNFQIEIVV